MGGVMELVGNRKGELVRMDNRDGQVHLEFTIPARGLIGLRTRMLTATQGDGDHAPQLPRVRRRCAATSRAAPNGVMVSMTTGTVNAFALNNLQERGVMFVSPQDPVYEGQIVAENSRDNDMVVNPTTAKQLTNMRTTSSDENIILKPARQDDAGAGAGVHRGRRAGRSDADQHPPAQDAAHRKRPQEGGAGEEHRGRRGRSSTYL